jgi:hypothetical protein
VAVVPEKTYDSIGPSGGKRRQSAIHDRPLSILLRQVSGGLTVAGELYQGTICYCGATGSFTVNGAQDYVNSNKYRNVARVSSQNVSCSTAGDVDDWSNNVRSSIVSSSSKY